MEALPVELMEIIFKELNQMENVHKCFHTCIFWNRIIANMYRENCKEGQRPENRGKNRFKNILPCKFDARRKQKIFHLLIMLFITSFLTSYYYFHLQLTIPELFYKIKNPETRTTSMPIE